MLRHFVTLAALCIALPAFADTTLEDCQVRRVLDDNVFEEGLSVEEYPDVSVEKARDGKMSVSVGVMQDWQQAEGDTISTFAARQGGNGYWFQRSDSEEGFVLIVNNGRPGRKVGQLFIKETSRARARLIAELRCK